MLNMWLSIKNMSVPFFNMTVKMEEKVKHFLTFKKALFHDKKYNSIVA